MKILNNKILILFSIGLNIGFLLFLLYYNLHQHLPKIEKVTKISIKALEKVGADPEIKDKVLKSELDFFAKIENTRSAMHQRRLAILKNYSAKKRDYKEIDKLTNELRMKNREKDEILLNHIKNIDLLLKDKAPEYFRTVYEEVKADFKRKK